MSAWAINWKQRLRFAPLHSALVIAECLARTLPRRWPRPWRAPWSPGISVVIPERGTPDLLAECLDAAAAALAQISEPVELIVIVNGAEEIDYAALRGRYPQVRWQFHAAALGYNGAIAAGLKLVQHDWVYLLNSDMQLEPGALSELLPYRQPQVFAITSQIFFVDPDRRREETGWSDCRVENAVVCMFEREPEPSDMARGNLYPGGGSSLCRTSLLRRYVKGTVGYSPFYYEDTEWGARAWTEGHEVLFCPRSRAHHHHRGTVSRHYDADEVQRVIARNALLFELRHGWSGMTPTQMMQKACDNDYRTQRELCALSAALGVLGHGLASRRAVARGFDFLHVAAGRYYPLPLPANARRPCVLLVSPFALFPPAHGGARRIAELCQRLAERVDLILLSDERSLYGPASEPYLSTFRAVHLVEGRGDREGEAPLAWPERLQRHAHPKLRAELERLIAVYDPDVVQLEFIELAALRPTERGRARWVVDLHDVYHDGGSNDAVFNRHLQGFDALTVCSAEDAALLDLAKVRHIPNGARNRLEDYAPSPVRPNVLFMGPFRYAPNREGIRAFLATVWPTVRAAHADATLTILGGPESAALASSDPLFAAPGVEMISRFVDPAPYLACASVTVNPQREIRGSSLKLIESLLAGRVCISTLDGARGFLESGLAGLVLVSDIAAMATPLIELLGDAPRRHALERPDPAQIQPYTWDGIAERQLALYGDLGGK
ncbi:MAG: glycosyltransferase [Arenimonas sp.]